ncbi:MAG: aminopeptidase, partial [Oscillospiraceae bacterium]|nr:aminopeptidase [Oscillospiraceae bacterium]
MADKKKEKSVAGELKESLFSSPKKGIVTADEQTVKAADDFANGYKTFLNNSKIEREAVNYTLTLAKQAGFVEYDPSKKYNPGDKIYAINRNKAIALAVIGTNGVKNGANLAIAHIDCPRIDLKPNPVYENSNLCLFKTHYYGGIKKYQWTAIPLSLHGRVAKTDGTFADVNIGDNDDDPCFTITDLLPHLSSEQAVKTVAKAIDGEDLNVLIGSRPYNSDDDSEQVKLNILSILNKQYGITEDDFLSAELSLTPAFKAKDVGFDRSMIGGYGHDDRVCAYPSIMAVLDAKSPQKTAITYLCDKEEIGSMGNTGMQSDFLKYFIFELAKKEGLDEYSVISKCKCLSADVNAAFDPTYASAYEARNSSYINNGVTIMKYAGHGGKAGTSDASAEFMGEIRSLLIKNNVIWQAGELGRVDLGGGGTISSYIANWNVDVVDIGVPVLSMHAPFEVVSKL